MYHLNRSNKFVIRMSKDTYQVLKKHLQVRPKEFSFPYCKGTQGCKHLPPLALKFPNPDPCTFFVCPQHSLLFIILFTIPRYSALLQNAFVTKLLQYLRCCSQAIIFYLSCTSYLPLHFPDFPAFQSGKINGTCKINEKLCNFKEGKASFLFCDPETFLAPQIKKTRQEIAS